MNDDLTVKEGVLLALRRAGWGIIAVILLHSILASVFGHEPYVDPAIQLCGGVAIAYLLHQLCSNLPVVLGHPSTLGRNLMAFGLTAAVAILMEVVEFILDNMLGTNFTGDVAETVRDLILGLLGAMVFLIGHWLGVRDAEQHEKDLG
ncbi:MAG TPA: hypothetical protein VFR59_00500 [Steroidobacteraceae bacterium]|nr:hypothetical protein [Steroidobacteraceae bacterium]